MNPVRVSVAIPPVFDFYFTRHRFSGLGASVLCRLLSDNGCRVQLFHFPAGTKKGTRTPLPEALDYLKPHIIENEAGKLSFFTRYQRFGRPIDECANLILNDAPDILFISCFAFCYALPALELANRVRALNPHVRIAVGGAGVSAYPDYFIRRHNIDFAFTGEAEVSIPSFLAVMQSGTGDFRQVPNLFWKKDGIVVSPMIRKLTTADEICFVMEKTTETTASVGITTALSRGCPRTCRFCSNFLCHGRTFRTVPIAVVRETIKSFSTDPSAKQKKVYINFEDDNLLLNPGYLLDVMDAFRSEFKTVSFGAENGIDHTLLTPTLAETLIRRGMRQFNLSIAGTHPGILARERRDNRFARYAEVIRIIRRFNLLCITYFICGFAQETAETVVSNIAFLAGQPTLLGISLFYPVPGIPDYEDPTIFDGIPPYVCAGSAAYPWNRSLSTAEMVTAFRLSRLVNLLKSENRTDDDNTLIAKIMADKRLYTRIREGKALRIIPVSNADAGIINLFFKRMTRVVTPGGDRLTI